MPETKTHGARVVALAGPVGSGKTTLLEALLHAAGAIERQGSVEAKSSVGDAAPEARDRGQSVELNLAAFEFMGDRYGVIDCPGSVEFAADADHALACADLCLVVADPEPEKAVLLQPILKELERRGVPRALFVNKIDQARGRVRDLLAALQPVSATPLVARQIPIWKDEKAAGFVDLALERAFVYGAGATSERVDIPADLIERETEARFHMLEQLADYDDGLMEQLLSDVTPSQDAVFADLIRETREGLITPVFLGSALNGFGVRRLLKALRHDMPEASAAAERLGAEGPCAYVFKTAHAGQIGKLALARVFGSDLADGSEVTRPDGEKARVGGLFSVFGAATKKIAKAGPGELVALGKLENAHAGEILSADGKARRLKLAAETRLPLFALAVSTKDRKDDVRLSGALAKLVEEDPGLTYRLDPETQETLLLGQGEVHLRTAIERLKRRFGVAVDAHRPKTAYRETIRKGLAQRGRHKKQTGGHGQFGDVMIELRPMERGEGFSFSDKISGGVVPKQWIPAVEDGVRDAMERGPLGFPVVDVGVVLTDGSYHAVDSSEIAFRTAGRIAMSEGLAGGASYLLEPVEKITIYAPSTATSRINSIVSGRRGQILGFDNREGWPGWDRIEVYLPESERQDLIVELRSATQGVGAFEAEFDHMAELTGRLADEVVKQARSAAA
ncbi:elongation factor G [Caulobacter sp. 17J65-9]|uniref:elongation factor G n=1 Tax=Caulobacter sp. 17J65-9 TaxID=2709382 RepID=UPI0013C6FE57|nr:elongation factor G [Caulobacter sp. 17J65-9]NEX91774.1 elongation factor G [Caulobacter sp. 17J65-9]